MNRHEEKMFEINLEKDEKEKNFMLKQKFLEIRSEALKKSNINNEILLKLLNEEIDSEGNITHNLQYPPSFPYNQIPSSQPINPNQQNLNSEIDINSPNSSLNDPNLLCNPQNNIDRNQPNDMNNPPLINEKKNENNKNNNNDNNDKNNKND